MKLFTIMPKRANAVSRGRTKGHGKNDLKETVGDWVCNALGDQVRNLVGPLADASLGTIAGGCVCEFVGNFVEILVADFVGNMVGSMVSNLCKYISRSWNQAVRGNPV
jgi:hypothetical protein